MPKHMKVSVIIPTYNRAALVKEAIQSVINQTFQDFEIIVVDDGSTDDTEMVVKNIVQDYKNTCLIRYTRRPHIGASAARNFGINQARSEYITFLDSDDIYMPEKLETQVKELDQNSDVGMTSVSALYLKNNKTASRSRGTILLSDTTYPDLLFIQNNSFTTAGVMVRADIVQKVGGFDESMHMCEDLDLWRRIARFHKITQIQSPLVKIRLREDQDASITKCINARLRYYQKAFEDDPSLDANLYKKLLSELYWYYGRASIFTSPWQPILARTLLTKGFVEDPLSLLSYRLPLFAMLYTMTYMSENSVQKIRTIKKRYVGI